MTFKAGDRVRVTSREHQWFRWTGTIMEVDSYDNIVPHRVGFDCGETHWVGSYAKLELIPTTTEEKVMRIANYDVVVVDNNSVKIGCQQVIKADVERVLAAMDGWDGGTIKPSELQPYQIAVAVSGPWRGHLFFRSYANNSKSHITHIAENSIDLDSGYVIETDTFYDDTRVRLCHWDGEKLTVPAHSPVQLSVAGQEIQITAKDAAILVSNNQTIHRGSLDALLKLMSEWRPVATLKVGDYVRVINAFDVYGPKKGYEMPAYKNLIGKFGKIIRISVNIAEVEFTERIDIDEDVAGVAKGHGRSFFLHQLERID